MRKIFYLILTFIICYILRLSDIWMGFTPILLLLMFLRFDDSFLWEIPMAVLAIGVLQSALADETQMLLRMFLPCGAVFIAYSAPKRLALFFPIAIICVFYNNIYAVCALGASVWYGARTILKKPSNEKYFTTKKRVLQGDNIR